MLLYCLLSDFTINLSYVLCLAAEILNPMHRQPFLSGKPSRIFPPISSRHIIVSSFIAH